VAIYGFQPCHQRCPRRIYNCNAESSNFRRQSNCPACFIFHPIGSWNGYSGWCLHNQIYGTVAHFRVHTRSVLARMNMTSSSAPWCPSGRIDTAIWIDVRAVHTLCDRLPLWLLYILAQGRSAIRRCNFVGLRWVIAKHYNRNVGWILGDWYALRLTVWQVVKR
jgi:hypothetical protein